MADVAWTAVSILNADPAVYAPTLGKPRMMANREHRCIRAMRVRNGGHAAELTTMIRVSALEDSFDIAWSFLEKSGELRGAVESANIILDSIEQQLRRGERRILMLANRAISCYRAQIAQTRAVTPDRDIIWLC